MRGEVNVIFSKFNYVISDIFYSDLFIKKIVRSIKSDVFDSKFNLNTLTFVNSTLSDK